MGDGIIAKFIYFWIFLIGGLFMARILGIADTASNMAVLSISMAFIYVGWNLLRAICLFGNQWDCPPSDMY